MITSQGGPHQKTLQRCFCGGRAVAATGSWQLDRVDLEPSTGKPSPLSERKTVALPFSCCGHGSMPDLGLWFSLLVNAATDRHTNHPSGHDFWCRSRCSVVRKSAATSLAGSKYREHWQVSVTNRQAQTPRGAATFYVHAHKKSQSPNPTTALISPKQIAELTRVTVKLQHSSGMLNASRTVNILKHPWSQIGANTGDRNADHPKPSMSLAWCSACCLGRNLGPDTPPALEDRPSMAMPLHHRDPGLCKTDEPQTPR